MDPDVEAERQQQAGELTVAAADIERAAALEGDARQQRVRRLRLDVEEIGADRAGEAARIGGARCLDIGRRDVVLQPARRVQSESRPAG